MLASAAVTGILCNYCRTREAYFLDKAFRLAACGSCARDMAGASIGLVFVHWRKLAESREVESHATRVARIG